MPEIRKVSRVQIRAAEILNGMGRGNDATRAIAAAKRRAPARDQTPSPPPHDTHGRRTSI